MKGDLLKMNEALEKQSGFSIEELDFTNHFSKKQDSLFFLSQLRKRVPIHNWKVSLQRKNNQNYDAVIDMVDCSLLGKDMFLYIERDIASFKQAKKRVQQINEQLLISLQERDILLGEIHHRVKNNLQIITSLIDLQNTGDETNKRFFKEIKNRIYLMSILHDQLYQSEDFKYVSIGDYIKGIADNLEKSYMMNNSVISTSVDSADRISINKAISCGLIVNELVSNAIQHALRDIENGSVRIEVHSSEDNHVIRISDNGQGFPDHIDFYHPTSLGLKLVHMLIQQLKGSISMKCKNGSIFTLTFPREKGVM
jgi:two-component sensor histidine kinase